MMERNNNEMEPENTDIGSPAAENPSAGDDGDRNPRYVYPGQEEMTGRDPEDVTPKKPGRWTSRLKMAVLLLVVAVGGFVVGQVVLLFAGSGSGVNNFRVMTKLSMLEAYVDHFFLNDTDGEHLEDYIYKGYGRTG